MTDKKHDVLNDAFRQLRKSNRVDWNPSTSRNPAERQRAHDALNRALRRASGRDAPEPGAAPETHPWRSLAPDTDEAA